MGSLDFEADLVAAAETLLQARYLFRDGHIDLTARLAADAVELSLKVLIPLPEHLRSRPGREIPASRQYRYRRTEAARRFNIPERDLLELHNLRLVDRFREGNAAGQRRVLTDTEAVYALKTADQVIRTLITAQEVSQRAAERVRERLALQSEPSAREELLEVVERQVGWGQYDPGVHARLDRLERQFGSPRARIGMAHLGRVVTLKAHAAMNTGRVLGPAGAIALAQRAAVVWEDQQNRERMIHVLKIQSIAFREIDAVDRCGPLVEEATRIAAGRRDLVESVDSERASVLLARGDPMSAAELLQDVRQRSRTEGESESQGRWLQQVGKALMKAGDLVRAEMMLVAGQELIPPDYLMAQCVGANALAELYGQCGDKVQAHRWAGFAQHLIMHKGFEHQGRVLDEILKAHPNIW